MQLGTYRNFYHGADACLLHFFFGKAEEKFLPHPWTVVDGSAALGMVLPFSPCAFTWRFRALELMPAVNAMRKPHSASVRGSPFACLARDAYALPRAPSPTLDPPRGILCLDRATRITSSHRFVPGFPETSKRVRRWIPGCTDESGSRAQSLQTVRRENSLLR
jgi:hypothetical protein